MAKELSTLQILGRSKVNPFIDKSHIVAHKYKIAEIEGKKDQIQNMYKTKSIKTHAQWASS